MAKPLSPPFDPRRLMEQAVAAMRKSRAEPRKDGKATPKVGAVLWYPDGSTQEAHRGELREGDHAEFTILERKNRDRSLEGCMLFATLEPCAPGSRGPHKTPCAERIVLARIKEVWVGIEDPDPTVDRKGIKYLEDCGVIVHMFERDLQDAIREANREFLSQAEQRAQAALDEPAKPVELSKLERSAAQFSLAGFSGKALDRFRSAVSPGAGMTSVELDADLVRRGLALRQGEGIVPTGYGILLFAEQPRSAMPQAGLLATIEYASDKKETKDFDGPLVFIPGEVEKWLKDKLPNVIDRSSMERSHVPALPFEMVREAVINALIHRDYDIEGAKVQLIVTPYTITVRSPGAPVSPITLEQMRVFNAPMLSRNPVLHYVFSKLDLAEERGFGLRSLETLAERNGLPRPTYTFTDPYLDLVIYRSRAAASLKLPPRVRERLGADAQSAWTFIATRRSLSASDLEAHLEIDKRKSQRILKQLTELGLLRRSGKGPSTLYEVQS